MKRREFIRKTGLVAAGSLIAPYILPSGRLFAKSGTRLANHVVFVLFGGGIRNQESVKQMYLSDQGLNSGNILPNMLDGAGPSGNLLHTPWTPILQQPLSLQGALFKEMRYSVGPTGHFNGHMAAMTGNYNQTGLSLNSNPDSPTIFEYYRKHNDPAHAAINAWWISEGLGPYPALNYSKHPDYGSKYGANFLHPGNAFGGLGYEYLSDASSFQPDDVTKIQNLKTFLNSNFANTSLNLPGIINTREDMEAIKALITGVSSGNLPFEIPVAEGISGSEATGDLYNIGSAWKVLEKFKPELTLINTFNSDICHSDFTAYLTNLHKADYGVGWLWNKIQNDPVLANDTVMICMPECGRNELPNNIYDANGLQAYDHTGDDNTRQIFSLIVGPPGVINQGAIFGTPEDPVGETVDILPTIGHILGFKDDIPAGMIEGRVLNEAFA
jgi:hypothetical protein